MALGVALSRITAPVFYGVMYWLVITPIGVIRRSVNGRSPLARRLAGVQLLGRPPIGGRRVGTSAHGTTILNDRTRRDAAGDARTVGVHAGAERSSGCFRSSSCGALRAVLVAVRDRRSPPSSIPSFESQGQARDGWCRREEDQRDGGSVAECALGSSALGSSALGCSALGCSALDRGGVARFADTGASSPVSRDHASAAGGRPRRRGGGAARAPARGRSPALRPGGGR
jgi:hypothetical protein